MGATVMLAAGWVDRWRDQGPILWIAAGAAVAVWLLLLGLLAVGTEPRRVRPGPATQELGGPETPAVVNLITHDWVLGHEAVPATLLDLAARRNVMIDQVGGRTLVRVRSTAAADGLRPYETMVLDHLRRLGARSADGYVPAEALTTGPDDDARRWWRRYSKHVTDEARSSGLSRARWPAAARLVLATAGIGVAFVVAAAASTLPLASDTNPIEAAGAGGMVTATVLLAVAGLLRGERDTPAGREAAARWLGLRELLADDHAFGEQPPAGVAIWERHLAHGAALGVAHGAVQALPLGAESDREAWSHAGGRWRAVRIRYPDRLPLGYGRHPLLVAFIGAVIGGVGVMLLPVTRAGAETLRDGLDDGTFGGGDPTRFDPAVDLVLGVVATVTLAFLVLGVSMFLTGVADLCRGRRTIEGALLRVRERGSDEDRYWHLAVDDGTDDRVRAWRTSRRPGAEQGAIVRARVSPWLAHVADLTVVAAAVDPPSPAPSPAPTT